MMESKTEIRTRESKIAATDQTQIKHGKQSEFNPRFIPCRLLVRISVAFPVLFCSTFLLILASGCQKNDRTEAGANLPPTIKTQGGVEMVLIPAGSFRMGNHGAK